jgi:spoIIIJ-associated protein
METIELTAPTLEDARRQAAAQFGIDPSDVQVTVLEEKKGLFGKAGSVKVKAERTTPAPEAPAAETPAPKKGKGRAKAEPAAAVVEEAPAEAPAPVEEEAPAPKPSRGRGKAKPVAVEEAPAEADPEPEAEEEPASVVATQEDADKMVDIFNQLFEDGDLRAKAKCVSITGKYINLELDGRDVGYLVGKRGEVLNALQYVGNVIASRQLGTGARVVIDGNSFRAKRTEVLEKQARDIAEQVKLNNMEAVLDPLPAFERRIVHQVLSEYPGVQTYSEGEEPGRRVVIAPAE